MISILSPPFFASFPLHPSMLHSFFAQTCMSVCVVCKKYNHISFLRFYAYMFVDLVKLSVLTLVSEIYSTTEMTVTIITCLHPHTSTDIK